MYAIPLDGCAQSVFQDIESYIRSGKIPQDDIQLTYKTLFEFYYVWNTPITQLKNF